MSKLSVLLNERNREGLSLREVARKAADKGHDVHHATVARFFNGRHGKYPELDTLEALASVLPVTVGEMRTALDLPPDPGQPWIPPDEARQLTTDQRAALGQLIKTIVNGGQSHGVEPPAQKTEQPATRPDNVRELSAKHRRMLEDAQDVDEAAYDDPEKG